ncbi:MAG: pepT [Crocinitomicaceae bacterium]|jgi:tripeptide aminopeptidase|nr:pepT [Crocinitomicaceae bacterium]
MLSITERFFNYVQIDTEADPDSATTPSSMKQKDLAQVLVQELQDLGITDAEMDEWGYVYATIPGNTTKKVPVICFCSHMDTAPDCSGKNVKPVLHRKWDGSPIILPDDPSVVITTESQPYLKEKIGDDIITASGLTLLGADDKAGIAIIMDLAQYLASHPEIIHGDIRILFTPDEEIGRGVDKVDMKRLNADYGYTLDGGELGTIEDETFSADAMSFKVTGVSSHPGYAKGKMVHASKIVAEFLASIPKDSWIPEVTEGREGFVHPVSMSGGLEEASITFIIRDHDTSKLAQYEARLENYLTAVLTNYPGATYTAIITEQYRNMKEILKDVPFVTDYVVEAMEKAGIQPQRSIIRGGTDGSRLSFMGLPCPNIFTGEMGIHSKQEYVSVQDMEKAVKTLVELVQIWEQKA